MRAFHAVRDIVARLAGYAHRGAREARLSDEMRFHLDMQADALVRSGLDPDEARRRALVAFGGRERWREEARDAYRGRLLDQLSQDLRYGVRSLLRARVFTAAAIGTLALGIGATTAMFSVVDAVLLEQLPYADPGRLVMLWEHNGSHGGPHNVASPANFLAWRDDARSFSSMAAFVSARFTIIGAGAEPLSEQTRLANASLLSMLGVRPLLGRLFLESDDRPGAPRVVVLDYRFWQDRFGGRPDVVGRTIRVNDEDATIVGVLPKDFQFFEPAALWTPIRFTAQARSWGGRYLRVIARLAPGVTVERADREMKTIALRRAADFPDIDANWTALAEPLHADMVGDARTPLLVLFGAVGFLLLIACANVANLMLARSADRRREMAVRIALGASPRRIARQLLTESVLLALVGAALGVVAAIVGTRVLVGLVPEQLGVLGIGNAGLDGRVLAFAVAVAVVTGLAFGGAPALQSARGDANDALKEGGRDGGADGRHSGRVRAALVVAEISLAVMLLAGTGLMVRSFARLRSVPLGFDPSRALVATVVLQSHRYDSDTAAAAFFEAAEGRLAALPGVAAVGSISWLPLSGQRAASSFTVVGQPAPPRGSEPIGDFRAVTPGYFRAMAIPLEAGRGIEPTDRANTPQVAVVSHTLAHTFWPDESAVGHELRYHWDGWSTVRIVGVAGDVHHDGPRAEPFMEIYRPLEQFPYSGMTIVVRAAAGTRPAALARPLRDAVRAVDADQPVSQLQPMTDLVSASVGTARLSTALFGLFGGIGLVLAMIGIYGVGSYTVQRRRREFGIRMALGAQRGTVLSMVIQRGLLLAGIGITIGIIGALALTRLMGALLFGVKPDDPVTFAWVAVVLGSVAALSSYVPARRATRVDPVSALRSD